MNFRAKNFLVSVVVPVIAIVLLNLAGFDGFILYGTIILAALIYYFLSFWLYNFNVHPHGFITILVPPVLWYSSFLMIYEFFLIDLRVVFQVAIISMFLALQYYYMSTQNILNISHFRSISLSQAAYTTNNFYTVLTFFTVCLGVFLIPDVMIIVKLGIVFFFFFLLYGIFGTLNHIDFPQLVYGVFLFSTVLLLVAVLFLTGLFDPGKLILISIFLTLIFRWMVVLTLFPTRKLLSTFDYFQFIFEITIGVFILYFAAFR